MKITVAKTAGFCFGVNRAVNIVEDLIKDDKKAVTYGQIIHNDQMVENLKARGVRPVLNLSEAKPSEKLVICSHGVGEDVFEKAEKAGLEVIDATCPFVTKIHDIVKKADEEGRKIFIAGNKNHQEVIGIGGHTKGDVYIFSDEIELENIFRNDEKLANLPITAVSQTTFNEKVWDLCKKTFKKVCTNAIIFDTICNATLMRQTEADELSRQNDAMIVVGGRHSSNTGKLFNVCKKNCERTVLVETAEELSPRFFDGALTVGVVAGASTPAYIIKEVVTTMSENLQSVEQEQVTETVQKSFEEMTDEEAFEASLSALNDEQKVVGVVLSVSENEIQVDIGRGLAGYVSADEYSLDPAADMKNEVKVGDKLNLIIMRTNDQEGTVMLSKRRFDAIAGWDNIVAAKEEGTVLTGTVKDVIKGGVVVYTDGIRVFVPASQATLYRSDSLDELKGKEVKFRIIEIGRGRKAVGSIRSVAREEKKAAEAKVWETIAVGDKYTGTVKSLTGYGAFVDIGGVDGMVHISELSWQRIKNPSEVVLVGDTVEVYVKAIDPEKKKISLGYKKPEENPWVIFEKNYAVGDTAKVTVVSMTSYGAFARIIPGIDGLIHISQIANKHVNKPQDELKIGEEVEAKITAVDTEKKRVSLSIRALLPEEVKEEAAEELTEAPETAEIAETAETPAEE